MTSKWRAPWKPGHVTHNGAPYCGIDFLSRWMESTEPDYSGAHIASAESAALKILYYGSKFNLRQDHD